MNDWKAQLAEIYKSYSTQQKNKKGEDNKFDKEKNFKGKSGFNDTGIPLTPKAANKQRRGRSSYRYPNHLKRINERRQKEARDRWNIKDVPAAPSPQRAEQTLFPSHVSRSPVSWTTPIPREKEYIYYDVNGYNEPKPEQVTYVFDKPKTEPAYKAKVTADGKFKNKLEESIYNHPNYKKQKF